MILTRNNNGKTVTAQYRQMRQQGVIDRSRLSQEQADWVGLQPGEGNGDYNPLTYQSDRTIPQGYYDRTLRVSTIDKTRGVIDVGGQGRLDGGHSGSADDH